MRRRGRKVRRRRERRERRRKRRERRRRGKREKREARTKTGRRLPWTENLRSQKLVQVQIKVAVPG